MDYNLSTAVTSTDIEGNNTISNRSKDWFLVGFVSFVDNFGFERPITLTVGGFLICGVLISAKKYFEEISTMTQSATVSGVASTEIADEIKSILSNQYSKLSKMHEKPADLADKLSLPPADFIHLQNAIFLNPNGKSIPSNCGVLWRGKISSVDGFFLGQITGG